MTADDMEKIAANNCMHISGILGGKNPSEEYGF